MLLDILRLLIETAASVFGSALLLRAYMQSVRLGGRNPLARFVFALTDAIVLPLRRLIPGRGGIDWASVIGAFAVALIAVLALHLGYAVLTGQEPALNLLDLCISALFSVIRWALYLALLFTLVSAVLSWVNPDAPMAPVIDVLIRPLLSPIRRIVPSVGGVDLSPLVLLVFIQIVLRILDFAERSVLASI